MPTACCARSTPARGHLRPHHRRPRHHPRPGRTSRLTRRRRGRRRHQRRRERSPDRHPAHHGRRSDRRGRPRPAGARRLLRGGAARRAAGHRHGTQAGPQRHELRHDGRSSTRRSTSPTTPASTSAMLRHALSNTGLFEQALVPLGLGPPAPLPIDTARRLPNHARTRGAHGREGPRPGGCARRPSHGIDVDLLLHLAHDVPRGRAGLKRGVVRGRGVAGPDLQCCGALPRARRSAGATA